MTVSELIAKLFELPGDLVVCTSSYDDIYEYEEPVVK